ncbi:MAG: response regulator [Candidatus Methylacidiphilales bacterium]
MTSVEVRSIDRFHRGNDTDWIELIDHRTTLPAHTTMEKAQEFFRLNPQFRFATVLDENEAIVGLCSERKVTNTLSQWGLGHAIYGRKPVRNHVLETDLRIIRGTPVHRVLSAIMERKEDFFNDVILIEADGSFIGLIGVATLVHLQHEINRQQYEKIKGISDQLNTNNEELAKARDVAMQATYMKSAFLANMSHEIRTPMNGILGMVKILLRTSLTPEQKRYAQIVQNSGNALLTILNDILDFSKIEAGKLEVEEIEFNLDDLVEETVQLMTERAKEKGLELFSWINADAKVQLISDPTRLRQVLLNLVSNAIKFTDQGEVMIRVVQESEDEQTATLRISVSDTGIGISPENQRKLFQAFQQADSATNRKFGGTGLGLAISKRITELLGGSIDLESDEGKGSTFSLTIPFKKQVLLEGQEDKETHDVDFWGVRALIVTESTAYGDYVKQLLAPWNVSSRQSNSYQEAIDIIQNQAERGTPLDIILLDSKIGEHSAMEQSLDLTSQGNQTSKIILMASHPEEISRPKMRALNINECLQKPLRPSDLRESITRVLKSKNASLTSPPPTPSVTESSAITSEENKRHLMPASNLRHLSLLLVEDSEVNREVAMIQLQAWGHTLHCAENGREAVEWLANHTCDGVLMDCQMPEMDGYQATQYIRDPASPVLNHHIYIIAMTANALQGDREKCLAAGMNDYVSKPVDDEELLAALERCAAETASHSTARPLPAAGRAHPPSISAPKQHKQNGSLNLPPHLIELFIRENEKRLEELEEALGQNKIEDAFRHAHTIKGTAGNFRAHELATLAAACESAAHHSRIDEVWKLLPEMKEAFKATKDSLLSQITVTPS